MRVGYGFWLNPVTEFHGRSTPRNVHNSIRDGGDVRMRTNRAVWALLQCNQITVTFEKVEHNKQYSYRRNTRLPCFLTFIRKY